MADGASGSRLVSLHPDDAVEGPSPLHAQSLEEVLTRGLSHEEKEGGRTRIHVRHLPMFFPVVFDELAHNEELRRLGTRQRLVGKLGAAILEQEPLIRQTGQERQRVLSEFSLKNVVGFYRRPSPYHLHHPVFHQGADIESHVDVNAEDGETFADLQHELRISKALLALLAMLAGIAQSRSWVRPEAVAIAQRELDHFRDWLGGSLGQRVGYAQELQEWNDGDEG